MPQAQEQRDRAIEKNTSHADLIVYARVKSVEPPPQTWSGLVASFQAVKYENVTYLKRPLDRQELASIVIFHPVVAGSMTAGGPTPSLKESLFKPGVGLIVFMNTADSRLESFDENYGILPYDRKTLEFIEHAVRK